MGTFLSLDESQGVLLIRFEGAVNDQVLLERFGRVREWLAGHGYYSSITDFSAVDSFEVTAQGVNRLAADAPLVPDRYRRVVVAPQDEIYGMTRMFEMLGSGTRDRVDVVRTMAEACRQVGVDGLTLRALIEW
jgi:hypothetical protein